MQVFSNLHTLFYKLGGEQISYTYDYLNRLTRKTVGTTPYTYTYYAPYENLESALPHSILYQSTAGPVKEFQYTYDNLGNIKTTWERTGNSPLAKTGEYWYDRFNQLTREETAGQTRFYEYDTYGNLLWVERYNYIGFEDLQDARNAAAYIPSYNLGTDVYTYGDSEWKDLLTAYNGHAITYDAIGNPLTYYNGADYTMTWRQGRRLSNVTTGGQTINYEYDSEGKRTGKQVGTAQTTYLYAGGRLVSIEGHTPDYRIDLLYDESGVYGCIYNDASHTQTKYRFVKNAQGDIIQIRDQSDAVVANYTYDAWGALLSVTDENGAAITASAHIALRNPIRYRGYLYDSETGFYYVSSRYYDPEIGRWINADSVIAGVGGSIQGYNMFAYCFNNPVNMSDSSGHWPQWMKDAANWVNNNIIQPVANFFSPSTNTISGQFQEGILRGSGSLTGGYSEINGRLQVNSKDSKNNGMLGGFAKVSTGNASGKIGVGNDNVALSLKGVGDGLTATAQAGIQYKNGAGLAAKAKAAVLSGRATAELELFGWQIEFGVSGDLLSVGAEAMIGVFPDEGFTAKANVGAGLFGAGFVFRVKPAQ